MVIWLADLSGDEIDMCCSHLPPNHNTRHFHYGFTWLKRLTSQEHKDIACILLRVVPDLAFSGSWSSAHLACLVRALLDFIYLSQYPVHTTESLKAMDMGLCQFHENKDVLIELGVWWHFDDIPKLHSLIHYTRSIALFGTTDNYNTKQSEHLHVDFIKNAYEATNFKDESKQMTTWLQCWETINQHAAFMTGAKADFLHFWHLS